MDITKLCLHMESLFEPLMNNKGTREKIQKFVGRISKMREDDFLNFAKEVKLLLYKFLDGGLITPSDFHHISFEEKEYVAYGSPCIPEGTVNQYSPRDDVLKLILNLGPADRELIYRLSSGMMRLKSVVPPRKEKEPSLKARLKYNRSITGEYTGNTEMLEIASQFAEIYGQMIADRYIAIKQYRDQTVKTTDDFFMPFIAMQPTSQSFHTIVKDIKGNFKTLLLKRSDGRPYNLLLQAQHPKVWNLLNRFPKTFVERTALGYNSSVNTYSVNFPANEELSQIPLITIFPIPESGGKERVVAVPCAVLQSLSYPIGKIAREVLDTLWNQGVKSHEGTTLEIASFLKDNLENYQNDKAYEIVHSVDMSDYTDRMPKQLSRAILAGFVKSGLACEFDLEVFDTIVGSNIYLDGKVAKYEVGTPMGTYPSFPLASLANGMVAWMAELFHANPSILYWTQHPERTRKYLNSKKYKVIGDDIVIFNDTIAAWYKSIMTYLGVEIQPSKCISSIYMAEMCSKLITHTGVYQQKKIDKLTLDSIGNIISNLEYYDSHNFEFLRHLSEKQFSLVMDILKMPKPYGLCSFDDMDYSSQLIWKAYSLGSGYRLPSITKMDLAFLDQRRKCIEPFMRSILTIPLVNTVDEEIDNVINKLKKQPKSAYGYQVLAQHAKEANKLRNELVEAANNGDIDSSVKISEELLRKINFIKSLESAHKIDIETIRMQDGSLSVDRNAAEQDKAEFNQALNLSHSLNKGEDDSSERDDHDSGFSM